jgi:hypothetical protein
MYETIKILHSYWAYLVLFILILGTLNSLFKLFGNKDFTAKDLRINLFTLIVSHIQLVLGMILYFISDYLTLVSEMGMGEVMKNSTLRDKIIEHPLTMIIGIILITVGYSKHKKKETSKSKFKIIAIFYTIALVLILAKIPWDLWLA